MEQVDGDVVEQEVTAVGDAEPESQSVPMDVECDAQTQEVNDTRSGKEEAAAAVPAVDDAVKDAMAKAAEELDNDDSEEVIVPKKRKKLKKRKKIVMEEEEEEEGGSGGVNGTAAAAAADGVTESDDEGRKVRDADSDSIDNVPEAEVDERDAAEIDAAQGGSNTNAALKEFEYPDAKAAHTYIMKPIKKLGKDRMLMAVLVYVVRMETELLLRKISDGAAAEKGQELRDKYRRRFSSTHSCNEAMLMEELLYDDDIKGGGVTASKVQEWRRTPEMRDVSSLSRRWLYVEVTQSNKAADADDYSCAIGAYNLRAAVISGGGLVGVNGADWAVAACATLKSPGPMVAGEALTVGMQHALCLTDKELTMCVFDLDSLASMLRAKTIPPSSSAHVRDGQAVHLPCLAGLPIPSCKAASMAIVSPAPDRPLCVPMPMKFSLTTELKMAKKTASGGKNKRQKLGGLQMQSVSLYDSPSIMRIMLGGYYHRHFALYKGDSNDTNGAQMRMSDERMAIRVKSNNNTKVATPACVKNWLRTPETYALCCMDNMGPEHCKLMRQKLNKLLSISNDMAMSTAGGIKKKKGAGGICTVDAASICRVVRRAQTNYFLSVRNRARSSSSAMTNDTDDGLFDFSVDMRCRLYLDLFADAFPSSGGDPMHDAEETIGRALGLRLMRRFRLLGLSEHLYNSFLKRNTPYPHVMLFSDLLDGKHEHVAHSVKSCFLPWLKSQRTAEYNRLLEQANHVEDVLANVLLLVMDSIERLRTARGNGERCVPIGKAADSVDAPAAVLKAVVNVSTSPYRVVANDDCAFFLRREDYEVDMALSQLCLDVNYYTNMTCDRQMPRFKLLRGGTSDNVAELLQREYEETVHNDTDTGAYETVAERVLVVIYNDVDMPSARDLVDYTLFDKSCEANERRTADIMTMEQVLHECGSSGPSSAVNHFAGHGADLTWAQAYSSVIVYAAHRYSYASLLALVATLAGVDNVPAVPKRMDDETFKVWFKNFSDRHRREPTRDDEEEVEKDCVDVFVEWAAEVAQPNFYLKNVAERCPNRVWGSLSNEKYSRGADEARVVLAYVGYARPGDESSRELLAVGNPVDDVYFSDVCNNEYFGNPFGLAEKNLGLAAEISARVADGELLFLPNNLDNSSPAHYSNIQKAAFALFKSAEAAKNNNEYNRSVKKFLERNRHLEAQAAKQRQTTMDKYMGNSVKINRMNVLMATYMTAMYTRHQTLCLPTYALEGAKSSPLALVPLNMERNATAALSRVGVGAEAAQHHVATVIFCEQATKQTQLTYYKKTGKALCIDADVVGFGRSAVMELMARLRAKLCRYYIFMCTENQFVQRALVPDCLRLSVSKAPHVTRLRQDPGFEAEESFFKSYPGGIPASWRKNRKFHYYACLQSAPAYMWQSTARAYSVVVGGGGGDDDN